jgi:hypothetical protein
MSTTTLPGRLRNKVGGPIPQCCGRLISNRGVAYKHDRATVNPGVDTRSTAAGISILAHIQRLPVVKRGSRDMVKVRQEAAFSMQTSRSAGGFDTGT